ncbi:IS607 family transposase [Actinoplanes regularis]|uniref:IS607 family transposase n=1 Tax=Actinoplanes regularis TaxID=52697 RepID=UPI002554396E|nr:IS607 family transposase [Actinoplanes regularis]
MLRVSAAAKRVGIHPQTLRQWADEGRVPFVRVGAERRFREADLDALIGSPTTVPSAATSVVRREALYIRVSGTAGQETSVAGQEAELRASTSGEIVKVFRDKASGLRENRPGLQRLLAAARAGQFTVVRVTHEDRLARFGAGWLRELLARDGVRVEVLHPKGSAGGMEELLADFMSLVSTFAGRMYGIRSREARQRLLARAGERVEDPGHG